MVVGRSLSPVRRRGTRCRNVYMTLPTALMFLAVFSKHSSSQSTNVLLFFYPGTQFLGNEKIKLCDTKSTIIMKIIITIVIIEIVHKVHK